jgi:membrane protease YdiL (CAAX protease family)
MNIPKRTAIYLSIFVVVGYWIYQCFTAQSHAIPPADFSVFVSRIVISKLIQLSAILLLLKLEGANWSEMGVTAKDWKKHVLTGLLYGLILFVLLNVGLSSVLNSIFPNSSGSASPILMYFNNLQNLVIWLVIGILGGGVVEELLRIFVLTRFEKAFRGPGLYLALICSSVVFGFGHLYQGPGTAISTGVSGLVMGIIFIRRRSALEVITVHAFSDVLAILAAYQLAGH